MPNPKILGKEAKNAQNRKEFLEKGKENQKGKEKKIRARKRCVRTRRAATVSHFAIATLLRRAYYYRVVFLVRWGPLGWDLLNKILQFKA